MLFPSTLDKLSGEKPTKAAKLVSDFANWFKSSVLTSSPVRKGRIVFLTFLLWTAIPAALVTMHRTHNDLKTLKAEILMEKHLNTTTSEQKKQSADMATIERNPKLEQKATWLNI